MEQPTNLTSAQRLEKLFPHAEDNMVALVPLAYKAVRATLEGAKISQAQSLLAVKILENFGLLKTPKQCDEAFLKKEETKKEDGPTIVEFAPIGKLLNADSD